MGLPRKVKNTNFYTDGKGWAGEVDEVTLPDLERKMEAFRAGGMDGEVEIDMGAAGPLVITHKYLGHIPELVGQFAGPRAGQRQVRFVAAVQRDDTGEYGEMEVVARGRHKKLSRGAMKPGEDTESTVETTCVYYKESWNGAVLVEIDLLNCVFIVDGEDLLAEQRRILGL